MANRLMFVRVCSDKMLISKETVSYVLISVSCLANEDCEIRCLDDHLLIL